MIIDFKNKIDLENLETISKTIKNGGIVVFPTETVYGIGANIFDENAVKKIFIAKGRPQDNPLIAHISDIGMLEKLTYKVNETEKKLMDNFWPGPLTIILPKKPEISNIVSAGLDTIGIRFPSNEIAKQIISSSGVPIVAPSANVSGKPSGTNLKDIYDELYDKVDIMVDGGDTDVGLESTVIRVKDGIVNILRPGRITKEDIEKLELNVIFDKNIFSKTDKNQKVASPGMKYKHYAPNSECIMVSSENNENKITKILEIVSNNQNKKILILCCNENQDFYKNCECINYGSKQNYRQIAKQIFAVFRRCDKINPDLIIVEGLERKGLGVALMNRMIRACAFNEIVV